MDSSRLSHVLPCETASVEQTIQLGLTLGKYLNSGDVVALYGELGSGKTHLVKGICSAFGVAAVSVTSPTFTIINEYECKSLMIYHFDAYRAESPDDFRNIGFEEYLESDGICLVEWPERVEPLLPDETVRLKLTHAGNDRRLIELLK